jgi:peroxiredoxin
MNTVLLIARLLLTAVFAFAAIGKLLDRAGSRQAVVDFGVPDGLSGPVAALLPVAELAVAVALLVPATARWGAVGALVLLGAFVVAIARSMIRGEAPDCHCFGALHSEPAGWRALARNALLVGVAAFVAIGGWNDPGPSAIAWIGRLDGTGTVALAAGLALALIAGAGGALVVGLLRQHGRLLLRVDELERRLGVDGAPPVAAVEEPEYGLPIGAPAPAFSVPGLYGETMTLESLIAPEQPVLLLFTDPNCGPCNALLPQIAAWQSEHGDELTLALLTRGSADDNRAKVREHGITSVWLDSELDVYRDFQAPGTPAAVLVDPEGQIASRVHAGSDAIALLVAEATGAPAPVVDVQQAPRPPSPPTAPPSLPVGAAAPAVELPNLDGDPVALSDSELDTVVLFWNPACGFCQQMVDELRAWEADPPAGAPRLLLISSGSVQDNNAMGLRAPILLDQEFAAGSAFGAAGTPSAVLVGRDGRVASRLGVGAPGVMALARGNHAGAEEAG